MEEETGAQLLERSTRRVRLTPEGRLFLEECRLAVAVFDRSVRRGTALAEGLAGEVQIGASDLAILGPLPGFIREFQRVYPRIAVKIESMERDRQFMAIERGELDIGFTLGPVPSHGFASVSIGSESLLALVPAGHPLSRHRTLRLADLAHEPFVLGGQKGWHAFRQIVDRAFAAAGFTPRITQEAFETIEIFALVAAGIGVSVFPVSARNVRPRGLVMRPLTDVTERIELVAVWRRDALGSAAKHMVEFLQAAMRSSSRD
jgi:DNA-binding transcriptional LysR family regulator